MTSFNDETKDANCYPFGGGKGTTIWEAANSIYLAHGGGTYTLYFTGTHPQCYDEPSVCNVSYTIHTTTEKTQPQDSTYAGPIRFALNSDSNYSDHYHSIKAGHDITETIDIEQSPGYNDVGTNWIKFTNNDIQVDVWIQGLTIVRNYQMCNAYPCDYFDDGCNGGSCTIPHGCGAGQIQHGPCGFEQDYPPHPDFTTRQDYPCNFENCGGVSHTAWEKDTHNGMILYPNTTYTWTWTNPAPQNGGDGTNNYLGPMHCFFNFNNVRLCDNSGGNQNASTEDVQIKLSLDGVNWVTMYHSRYYETAALGVDCTTLVGYNDSPGASNTLRLHVPVNPNPGVNTI